MIIATHAHRDPGMDNQTTFEHGLNLWLATRKLGKKQTTKRFYEFVDKIIRPNWPDLTKPIVQITSLDVLTFAEKVADYSPTYWNACVSVLRFICPQAATRDIIKRKRQKVGKFIPPSQQQFEAFLRECDAATRTHAGLIVRFLALTGLRWGQAQSIRWEHVREESIEVPAQKNGMPHTVPMVAGLPQVLARLKSVCKFGEYVLPRAHPRRAINSASKRAGLTTALTPHKFRHYYATRGLECGVDILTISQWLGHKDKGKTAMEYYLHVMTPHTRAMAAKVQIAA
jgi:integrase